MLYQYPLSAIWDLVAVHFRKFVLKWPRKDKGCHFHSSLPVSQCVVTAFDFRKKLNHGHRKCDFIITHFMLLSISVPSTTIVESFDVATSIKYY